MILSPIGILEAYQINYKFTYSTMKGTTDHNYFHFLLLILMAMVNYQFHQN